MCSNRAGVGTYVLNLYNELVKAGVDVVTPIDETSISLVSSVGKVSSRLRATFGKYYPPFVGRAGDAVYRYLYRKDTGRSGYDLYHETNLEPMPAIRTRSVCNIYDFSFVRYPNFFIEGFAEKARMNAGRNAAAVDRIIVNTRFIKEEAMEILKLPGERIDVIPLAAPDSYRKAHDPSSGDDGEKRYTEKEYILYVGTVEPRKNLKTLIRAYKELRGKYDVALVIAGGLGWFYDDIVAYPGELGLKKDVIFTNYINEGRLRSLYDNASVFVYPSVYEGFGIPPLEAMTCGVPAVLSDIPSLREVAGDSALYFHAADHEELAHKVGRLLSSESLRTDMKQRGLRRAKEYSWQRVGAETIRTYEKALNN
jgi:glycosyltransferase involved in cell wall biosynthesis